MIVALLVYVVAQRLVELAIARRNTQRLVAQGAVEVGAGHYPLIVAVHALWLVSIIAWVMMRDPAVNMLLLAIYGVLQIFRIWVMASLGPYWTTRIITLPGAPLVRRGPYRFLRHPNYVVVALEIAVLPLAVEAYAIAGVFIVANALMMLVRIRAEEQALAPRGLS